MQNHSEIAEFLWKIADLIKDDYDAKDYENVILPFTLLRRLGFESRSPANSLHKGSRSSPKRRQESAHSIAPGAPDSLPEGRSVKSRYV